MSEEKRKLSAFEAFKQTQLTFAEAEEKAKQEAGAPKVERFRIGEDGEYSIRVLPLAPSFDNEGNIIPMDRKGYEYAVHQFFLTIEVPGKKGKKPKKISIPVIRTTDKEVGKSVDLLDTYVKIGKEMYDDEEDLMKLFSASSYEGGIRWNYQHAIMVLDVSSDKERAKGPQLWQCSHSQYKDLDAAKMRLWAELKADDGQDTCPISGFTNAYPVKVIRTTENNKTGYKIEIGRKTLDITEAEAEKLLELPRLPEQLYRYTRYQLEATLVFLQQYDEKHDMEVCKEPDFIEAVEKLKGELSPEDTSHFDIATATNKEDGKDEVTIDSLYAEYDNITDQGLNDKSEEYKDLREKSVNSLRIRTSMFVFLAQRTTFSFLKRLKRLWIIRTNSLKKHQQKNQPRLPLNHVAVPLSLKLKNRKKMRTRSPKIATPTLRKKRKLRLLRLLNLVVVLAVPVREAKKLLLQPLFLNLKPMRNLKMPRLPKVHVADSIPAA